MTSNRQGQRRLRVSQQTGKNSRWGGILAIALLAVLLSAPAHAAFFVVNGATDVSDANLGDGVCATGGGVCTLRAAIEEANTLAGADTTTCRQILTLLPLSPNWLSLAILPSQAAGNRPPSSMAIGVSVPTAES